MLMERERIQQQLEVSYSNDFMLGYSHKLLVNYKFMTLCFCSFFLGREEENDQAHSRTSETCCRGKSSGAVSFAQAVILCLAI